MKFITLLLSVVVLFGTAYVIAFEDAEEAEPVRRGHVTRRVLDNGHRILISGTDMRCRNKYNANPCGPEAVCEDTEDGISCTSGWTNGCPTGCDRHSSCIKNEHGIYRCECHEGYEKPDELSLQCWTKEEAVEYREWSRQKFSEESK
jgi:hypothetical protein